MLLDRPADLDADLCVDRYADDRADFHSCSDHNADEYA